MIAEKHERAHAFKESMKNKTFRGRDGHFSSRRGNEVDNRRNFSSFRDWRNRHAHSDRPQSNEPRQRAVVVAEKESSEELKCMRCGANNHNMKDCQINREVKCRHYGKTGHLEKSAG